MSELDEAAKSVAALSKLLGPISALVPALEKMGPLEKYLDTLEAKVEVAKRDEGIAQQRLRDALRATEKAEADHDHRKRALADELARLRGEAEFKIAESVAAAEQNAAAIIGNARTTAASIKADARPSRQ